MIPGACEVVWQPGLNWRNNARCCSGFLLLMPHSFKSLCPQPHLKFLLPCNRNIPNNCFTCNDLFLVHNITQPFGQRRGQWGSQSTSIINSKVSGTEKKSKRDPGRGSNHSLQHLFVHLWGSRSCAVATEENLGTLYTSWLNICIAKHIGIEFSSPVQSVTLTGNSCAHLQMKRAEEFLPRERKPVPEEE